MSLRPVVTDDDRFIECAEKERIDAESLPHRAVWGMVHSPRNHVWLVQWRRPTKGINPNLWDVSCGGHVDCIEDDASEFYPAAYQRELFEELGLSTMLVSEEEAAERVLRGAILEPISIEIGHSAEYHHYPTDRLRPDGAPDLHLEREQVRHYLTLYDGAVSLPPEAEAQAIAWLTTEQIRAELIEPQRATIGLSRLLERCLPVVGRLNW